MCGVCKAFKYFYRQGRKVEEKEIYIRQRNRQMSLKKTKLPLLNSVDLDGFHEYLYCIYFCIYSWYLLLWYIYISMRNTFSHDHSFIPVFPIYRRPMDRQINIIQVFTCPVFLSTFRATNHCTGTLNTCVKL